jgi:adenine-specific DNA-methyltransferase
MHALDIECLQVCLEPRSEEQLKAYKNPDNDPRGLWRAQDLSASKPYSAGVFQITTPAKKTVSPPPGRYWRCSKPEYERLLLDNRITFGISGEGRPMLKAFLTEAQDGVVPNTWWSRNEVGDNKEATLHLKDLFHPEPPFSTPKPTRLVQRCIQLIGADSCLDFFAGSGTTGEAAIALTRKDKKKRRYHLCESGAYFDTILLPRLKKNIHSDTWKEGKPASRNGISHAFKYLRLESYEDALNNLELKRSSQQELLLDADAEMREQYTLSYMLDVESRGSQSLLNVEAFRNPDEYKLRVERNGETQLVNVDLVETFNWLLGLTVKHIDVIRGVRVVEGTAPNGDRVLVLWRNIDQMDNDTLDKWFEKQDYNTREMVYDVFYVNGDNNLENLRRLDQTWKVRLIEEDFKRLMFDVEDV